MKIDNENIAYKHGLFRGVVVDEVRDSLQSEGKDLQNAGLLEIQSETEIWGKRSDAVKF